VVLADNASTDDSASFTKQHFPSVKIVQLDRNYGYAGGYNHALREVQADYYILLNNDIEVVPGWIEPMIAEMEKDASVGACQPKLLDYHNKGVFEYAGAAGGYIDRYGYPFCRGRIFTSLETDIGQYDEPADIFWATGACMLIRAKLFHEAGGFDQHFFAHMEEIDLCWRLQLMGYRLRVIPQSKVYHVGGGTLDKLNSQKTFLNFRNSLLMLYKNLEGKKLWSVLFMRAFLDLIASIRFLVKGQFKHSAAIHKAHAAVFFHLRKWRPEREATQAMKIADSRLRGMYPGSLVIDYFLKKKLTFHSLNYKA
jgi:GT2 family glycosyltransferase